MDRVRNSGFALAMLWLTLAHLGCHASGPALAPPRANIILLMADDLGWGDTGYNGHPMIRTPNLDAMAREGITFTRFYSQAPVCSPTRGSCLTGRHPYRYDIPGANAGHMLDAELTLGEMLQALGYRTGHFGKWHLGTLTKTLRESNRGGPRGVTHYAPPWEHGFDTCFSTEAKVPTWDPMRHPQTGEAYGTHYWTGSDQRARENLEGDDSRVIMDRAIPFVEESAARDEPFFAVIWFHAPHLPVVAGREYLAMYEGQSKARAHYYGCITAMDEQIGRLRQTLDELGVTDETIIFFCSDNGPEGARETDERPGSTAGLRGRKRSLYEGGIRVPGVMVWPGRMPEPRTVTAPASTSDYLPTLTGLLDVGRIEPRDPLDGVSLMPLIEGEQSNRGAPIGFKSAGQRAWIGDRYKLYSPKSGGWELYDLIADPGESTNLAEKHPEIVQRLEAKYAAWEAGVEAERALRRR